MRKPINPHGKWLVIGDITAWYECGTLRYIKLGDEELIRMVYFAARDTTWATAKFHLDTEELKVTNSNTTIYIPGNYKLGDIDFRIDIEIFISDKNEIKFSYKGECISDFMKNRLGLCVLHPIKSSSNANCVTNNLENKKFPKFIEPHQPFVKISEMEWKTPKGNLCKLKFEGDIFETEDQRNWMDASFKTYSTPLILPFPVQMRKGEKSAQAIDFKFKSLNVNKLSPNEMVNIALGERLAFPQIGSCYGLSVQNFNAATNQRLKNLKLNHLHVQINFQFENWKLYFEKAIEFGIPLELILFLDENSEQPLSELIFNIHQKKVQIDSITIFSTSKIVSQLADWQKFSPILRNQFPSCKLGAGTNQYFAELNRNRIDFEGIDFLKFPVNPQVHAIDDLTIIESLEVQGDMVKSTQSFIRPPTEIHISPIYLKSGTNIKNFNVYPENPENVIESRQFKVLNAGWFLSSIANFGLAGATKLSFYEVFGTLGIITQSDSFNVLHQVWKNMMADSPKELIKLISSDTLQINGLAYLNNIKETKIWIWNASNFEVDVHFAALKLEIRIIQKYKNEAVYELNRFCATTETLEPNSIYELKTTIK